MCTVLLETVHTAVSEEATVMAMPLAESEVGETVKSPDVSDLFVIAASETIWAFLVIAAVVALNDVYDWAVP
jgi:hypothetical protein